MTYPARFALYGLTASLVACLTACNGGSGTALAPIAPTGASATATPTAAASAAPTVQPSASPSVKPGTSPSASPSAASTATAAPSATPAPSSSPTPVPTASSSAACAPAPTQAVWAVAGVTLGQTVTSEAIDEYCIAQLKAGTSIAPLEHLSVPTTGNIEDEAFDTSGDLWVLKLDAAPNNSIAESLLEYSAAQLSALHLNASPTPVVTLTSSAFSNSLNPGIGIAFDAAGNLWVADYAAINEFTTAQLAQGGAQTPVVTLTPTGVAIPSRLTFDAAGNLWFVDATLVYATPSIHELSRASIGASGSPTPVASFSAPTPAYTTPNSQIACSANDLAFDGAGNLWGAESGYLFEFTSAQLGSSSGSPSIFIGNAGDPIAGLQVTGPTTSLAIDRSNDLFTAVSSTYGGGAAYSFDTLSPAQYGATPPTETSDAALGNNPSQFAIAAGPYVP